ncbi:hypothetical protein AVEN_187108-1 [Araneus ventricosus]|uniref:Uncharacterized protein n=1 Tax=Araneus ventricosus TaxID=182803 RepID=A0A4Y2EXE0_ARAVE|nr:hypothetical protein AVEN_187108-1 [Araneus ventricosus]
MLDWVNYQKDFLPSIKLGAYVLDDCDKDTYGLEQAVYFIKGDFFLLSPLKPGLFGTIRHELYSSNLGGPKTPPPHTLL